MQRVLITGGSGLLALNWACCMRDSWEPVLALHSRNIKLAGTRAEFVDLESAAALKKQLASLRPDLVVHAAGLTSVDQCEEQPAVAMHVNAELARNVAAATAAVDVKLIHISTDHLFDGGKSLYTENDPPAPINVYARTKLQGEEWVLQENPAALVVRTNFFGWGHRHRQSFSDWIIASLRAGTAVTMFDDAYFTPILADALARSAHELVGSNAHGIINIVGDERISKYDFAMQLAQVFGLPAALIQRGKLSAASLFARRSPDMSLDNAMARRKLGGTLGSLNDFFAVLRQQEAAGRRNELLTAVME